MRQIAEVSGVSTGNLYHHFGSKELIFQALLDEYWNILSDPALGLNQVHSRARFPDDLEELAAEIEKIVDQSPEYIRMIYVDMIEFRGQHSRYLYEVNTEKYADIYRDGFSSRQEDGELGDIDPLVALMMAARWFFYFYTVEKCFGVSMHFGMSPGDAVREFIRILRYGVLPRSSADAPKRKARRARAVEEEELGPSSGWTHHHSKLRTG